MNTEHYYDLSSIPFVLHKEFVNNHSVELSDWMYRSFSNATQKELREINHHLKAISGNAQKYLKIQQAAALISVSVSFLQKNMGGVFQEGKHYFYPGNDIRLLRWDKEALEKWVQGESRNDEDKALIAKLLD